MASCDYHLILETNLTSNAKLYKRENKSVVKGLMEAKNMKSENYQQRLQTEKEKCKHFVLFYFEFPSRATPYLSLCDLKMND